MNLFDFKQITRRWASGVGIVFFLGFILFPALCLAEVVIPIPAEKAIKASLAENSPVESHGQRYDLPSIIRYALKNNPDLRIASKNIEAETYGINSARADRAPKINLGAGITRLRYETPLTPVVIELPLGPWTEFPPFRRTIQDTAVSFQFPLFEGGRLYRGVTVAQVRKTLAQDNYRMSKQDLVYNLTSLYYKIAQLEELLRANDASVEQLESHTKNVDLYVKTGTAPKLDLLNTEVELSHALENRLLVKNNLSSAYELLRTLMGMDDTSIEIAIATDKTMNEFSPILEESLAKALSQRPDYRAVAKKSL